ncbi:putative desumoylating isopeptidase 1 [Paratrimastix pyriformis]|uniref:Desumoylating isopeptidase 1 n=1 Tax=Paratrimastix pyriformis TaxID=342808 RepID=A0ABQ8UJD4_9EUKA|nr:putative desumoylating isopeptidase 1 [Paratrimastix pyriformis]
MSGTPVKLHVYDMTQGMAKQLSRQLLGHEIEGVWHTGVIVYGVGLSRFFLAGITHTCSASEYFFGGGIERSAPGASPAGRPLHVIDLGTTAKTQVELEQYISSSLRQKYNVGTYHLLQNNCNNFSSDVAVFLTGKPIPSWITGLPAEVMSTPLGRMLEPMINQDMFGGGGGGVMPNPSGSPFSSFPGGLLGSGAPSPQLPVPAAPTAPAMPWLRGARPILYEGAQLPMIMKAIRDAHTGFGEGTPERLTPAEEAFVAGPLEEFLKRLLAAPKDGRVGVAIPEPFMPMMVRLVGAWPANKMLPILDTLRIAALHPTLNQTLRQDPSSLCNLFSLPETAQWLIGSERVLTVVTLGIALLDLTTAPVRQAGASLLHNVGLAVSREEEDATPVALKALAMALKKETDLDTTQLLMRAMGAYLLDGEMAQAILQTLDFRASKWIGAANPNVVTIARELMTLLGEQPAPN